MLCGQDQYEAHIAGEPHKKRERGESGKRYECKLCGVQLSGDQARIAHEFGKMHQNNLARVGSEPPQLPQKPEFAAYRPPQPSPSPLPTLVASAPWQHASVAQHMRRPQEEASEQLMSSHSARNQVAPPQRIQRERRGKRDRDEGEAAISSGSRRNHLDMAARLRDLAAAIERKEHGVAPFISIEVVAQRGSRAVKRGSRFKLTVDEVFSGSDEEESSEESDAENIDSPPAPPRFRAV